MKIIIRGRPLTRLPQVEALDRHPLPAARELGAWFQERLATDRLIERERYLIVPGASDAELRFRADALDNAMRQQRFQAQRVSTDELPLLRTRGWDPRAQEARESPEHLEEGATEMVVDGWWSRTYVMGRLPSAILTNWTSPLFAGDEPIDIAIDLVPKDVADVQHDLEVRVNRLTSSHINVKRRVALEQLDLLAEALERRKVIPFDMQISVLVRGTSRQDVRDRSRLLEERVHSLGARLHVLRGSRRPGCSSSTWCIPGPSPIAGDVEGAPVCCGTAVTWSRRARSRARTHGATARCNCPRACPGAKRAIVRASTRHSWPPIAGHTWPGTAQRTQARAPGHICSGVVSI